VKRAELLRLILQYLLQHPDASDTIEGITHWWVSREIIKLKIAEVSDVVSELVSQGLLLQRLTGNSVVVLSLNKGKIDEIRRIVNNTGSND